MTKPSYKAAIARRDACIKAGTHGRRTRQIAFGIYCDVCQFKVGHITEAKYQQQLADYLKGFGLPE